MSALRGVAAVVTLLLATPASAFVQSTSQKTGAPLAWKDPRVTFVTNSQYFDSKPGCANGVAAMDLARQSLPTWNEAKHPGDSKVCTSFQFVDGGDSTSKVLGFDGTPGAHNENLIVFRSRLCSAQLAEPLCTSPLKDSAGLPDYGPCIEKTNCWDDFSRGPGGIIALTTVSYDPDTGEIRDADMELHDLGDPAGMYFTCAAPGSPKCATDGQANCIKWDVGNTVTHEAGHMLGLDHCVIGGSGATACPNTGTNIDPLYPVMAPEAAAGDTDKRTLKPDDVNGVCSIYPLKDTGGGGCGCGTASASGLALLGLFLAGFRPRRRRAQ